MSKKKYVNLRSLQLAVFYICIIFLVNFPLTGQFAKRTINAVRIASTPRIDGELTEKVWESLPLLTDFVQYNPYNGKSPSQRTDAWVGYDDTSIYIAARCYDDSPQKIRKEVSIRDQWPSNMNVDAFAVHLSPYNDGINSCAFYVTAAGVQMDIKFYGDHSESTWDVVWESSVHISDSCWVVEMKIPLSALRFSSQSVQNWGLNLWRWIARKMEWDHWSFIDINYPGWWKKPGELRGIKNLRAPTRLSFTPYISGYLEHETHKGSKFMYNGGIDLKYGITDSFTLDSTLVPDFGQIQSDDQELNLSPYEIKFNEKRQFFTEGTELFNKGDIFYSRRIGKEPVDYHKVYGEITDDEEVLKNPQETRLINATKVSGRTNFGLGIGVLNAMTSNTYATVSNRITGKERKILTQRFTNYNLLVLDQTLFHHSYISLINSNVLRKGYVANVTAFDLKLADKTNTYSVSGIGAYSQVRQGDTNNTGGKLLLNVGKIGGKFQAMYDLSIISNNYNQNDLGYLRRSNEFTHQLTFIHNASRPFACFLALHNTLQLMVNRVFKPGAFSELIISYDLSATFKNYYDLGLHAELAPVERNDYYEPRVFGRFFVNYKYHKLGVFGNTDPRKPFYIWAATDFTKSYDYDFDVQSKSITVSPRFRFSDHLNLTCELVYGKDENQPGYVSQDAVSENIYFGERNRQTIVNTIEANYLINNKLSLNFRLRHYWSKAQYNSYYELMENGRLKQSDYNSQHNINYNAFNIYFTLRWNFAPGSEILLNWKNAIFTSDQSLINNYWKNFSNVIKEPQANSLSIKILYYFDI